jgi:4a-hydroxytetrahydrobiopterin dehydratase
MSDLTLKKCLPCEEGTPPLEIKEVEKFRESVPAWHVEDGSKRISREFSFKDFAEALIFVNKVAARAESEGHHPNILIHEYKHVRIELYTHAVGGLSENDFILAAKIDQLI